MRQEDARGFVGCSAPASLAMVLLTVVAACSKPDQYVAPAPERFDANREDRPNRPDLLAGNVGTGGSDQTGFGGNGGASSSDVALDASASETSSETLPPDLSCQKPARLCDDRCVSPEALCGGSCGEGFYACRGICAPGVLPVEVCDGVDNDCDGQTDEGADLCLNGPRLCLSGKCAVCQPTSRRCGTNAVQMCSQDGSAWSDAESCPFGCDASTRACRRCSPKQGQNCLNTECQTGTYDCQERCVMKNKEGSCGGGQCRVCRNGACVVNTNAACGASARCENQFSLKNAGTCDSSGACQEPTVMCQLNEICAGNRCVTCGGTDQDCCAGNKCDDMAFSQCYRGKCRRSGKTGQPCWPDGTCDFRDTDTCNLQTNLCEKCGGLGEQCCPVAGAQCREGRVCDTTCKNP